jgi:aspartyl-tRNA(Asn)/glutamyl-tRNA(Gln) amidotransferase subunit C
MAITKEEITQVAKLARLALSEDDLAKYTTELDKILDYIQRLNSIDTNGIEPLISAFIDSTPTRLDQVAYSDELDTFREEFLKIAPQSEGRFFKVPKMGDK